MKIGCLEVIQIVIIILKLCNIIDCSWFIVFMPTLLAILLGFLYGALKSYIDNEPEKIMYKKEFQG